eukprot:2954587-Rhodomonas_salina.2
MRNRKSQLFFNLLLIVLHAVLCGESSKSNRCRQIDLPAGDHHCDVFGPSVITDCLWVRCPDCGHLVFGLSAKKRETGHHEHKDGAIAAVIEGNRGSANVIRVVQGGELRMSGVDFRGDRGSPVVIVDGGVVHLSHCRFSSYTQTPFVV